ncbi:hypothetical protein PHMEG_0002347 [Phytophthora megakarya]|uniref:Eukaryotic/viral aspartic protease n=1 Tax=Phytophthora megakarya TaxID=4795 RepID=A0A225WZG1_9STRA|nr:hypothetical protein PHMEG_0002347 [Phytophthora megakarya]
MSPQTKMNSHLNSNPGNAELLFSSFRPIPPSYLFSGASISIIIQDLAHRLKLRAETRGEFLLNGIDGVKTKVMNKCRVKITLGHRVVYTLDVWVGNIGQGIDVLLGMNFRVAAGVRLCAHEGEVVLPDEERILLVGCPKRSHLGRTIDHPGQQVYPDSDLGTGPRVLGRVGQSGGPLGDSIPVAARVVNISRRPVQVLPHTKVTTLTDRDRLPFGTNFVRSVSYQYDEREFPVYENTRSPTAERRLNTEVRNSNGLHLPWWTGRHIQLRPVSSGRPRGPQLLFPKSPRPTESRGLGNPLGANGQRNRSRTPSVEKVRGPATSLPHPLQCLVSAAS